MSDIVYYGMIMLLPGTALGLLSYMLLSVLETNRFRKRVKAAKAEERAWTESLRPFRNMFPYLTREEFLQAACDPTVTLEELFCRSEYLPRLCKQKRVIP